MATKIRPLHLGRSFSGRTASGCFWVRVQWQHVDGREFLNRSKGLDDPRFRSSEYKLQENGGSRGIVDRTIHSAKASRLYGGMFSTGFKSSEYKFQSEL